MGLGAALDVSCRSEGRLISTCCSNPGFLWLNKLLAKWMMQRQTSPLAALSGDRVDSSPNEAMLGRNGSLEPKGFSMMGQLPNMASVLQRPRSNGR